MQRLTPEVFIPVCRRLVYGCVALVLVAEFGGSAARAAAQPANQPVPMPRAVKHESRHEIDQIEERWRTAMLKGDSSALNAMLADDYTAITASGNLQNKDEALASMNARGLHFTTFEISDRKVRFYGTTAVVTSLANVEATTDNRDFSGSFRYTRVYVRNAQGQWKIVSFEASRLRPGAAMQGAASSGPAGSQPEH
jgi:ketosteroid isomerase-like protein